MQPTKRLQTIENIKKVALVFFIISGLAHLSSSAMIANSLFVKEAFIINKTFDIPFLLTGLIYGLSALRLTLSDPEKEYKRLDIILIVIIMLVLLGLIAVNLIFPDLNK
jgi:succinate dehydrogenase hydrophobic anchor subunit